jgi:hypothetical protein
MTRRPIGRNLEDAGDEVQRHVSESDSGAVYELDLEFLLDVLMPAFECQLVGARRPPAVIARERLQSFQANRFTM